MHALSDVISFIDTLLHLEVSSWDVEDDTFNPKEAP